VSKGHAVKPVSEFKWTRLHLRFAKIAALLAFVRPQERRLGLMGPGAVRRAVVGASDVRGERRAVQWWGAESVGQYFPGRPSRRLTS